MSSAPTVVALVSHFFLDGSLESNEIIKNRQPSNDNDIQCHELSKSEQQVRERQQVILVVGRMEGRIAPAVPSLSPLL